MVYTWLNGKWNVPKILPLIKHGESTNWHTCDIMNMSNRRVRAATWSKSVIGDLQLRNVVPERVSSKVIVHWSKALSTCPTNSGNELRSNRWVPVNECEIMWGHGLSDVFLWGVEQRGEVWGWGDVRIDRDSIRVNICDVDWVSGVALWVVCANNRYCLREKMDLSCSSKIKVCTIVFLLVFGFISL